MGLKTEDIVILVVKAYIFGKQHGYPYIEIILRQFMDLDKLKDRTCPFCGRRFRTAQGLFKHLHHAFTKSACSEQLNLIAKKVAEIYNMWISGYYHRPSKEKNVFELEWFLKQRGVLKDRAQSQ